MAATTLNQLIKDLTKINTVTMERLHEVMTTRVLASYQPPIFEPSSVDPVNPYLVGTFGGLSVVVAPYIQPVAKMQVSKEFERLQHPDLVKETNEWLLQRFGTYFPVYVIGANVYCHPQSYAEIRAASK